jgi:hypothetical protein
MMSARHVDGRGSAMTVRGSGSCTGPLFAAVLCLQLACLGEDAVQGNLLVTEARRTQALTSADLASVNGTYGAGCRNRSGAWSLAAAPSADLDHDELSVVRDNISCVLTLTELHTTQAVAASPSIELTTSFGGAPSEFGVPLEFYADAALSSVTFASAFVLTVRYSDDPRLRSASNTARPLPPTVVPPTTPVDNAVNRSIATRPRATFSVAMDPTTLTDDSFTVRQGGALVPGVVTVDVLNRTATFTPDEALGLSLVYEVTVSTDVEDARHTPLEEDFVWHFTTAAVSQGPLYLESASSFAVLGATTVTSTGGSVIGGDLGVSSNTAVTGFPPGTLIGTQYAGGPIAAQAQTDLAAAVLDASSRTLGAISVAGDIGGQTLTPGLYNSTSSLAIAMADLTLDADGEEDAIFLIKIESTLTLGGGSKVVLTDGALAANVYWLVGSSATLGTGSILQGTIMADTSITFNDGAALTGRALAQSGAVTLINNAISRPPP